MVNIVIAPDIYTCDRIALQGAFVVIDGVLQKICGATPRCATRWDARLVCREAAEARWANVNVVAQRLSHV